MGDKTGISWTDATWAPARGCSRVSEGCRNCYAERIAARFSKPGQAFHGFAQVVAPRDHLDAVGGRRNGWTRKVEFQPHQLAIPLRWKRPRRIFCSSMTDIFHESLANEEIAAIFGVMAACPQHTFQVLTKRPKRMREWFAWLEDRIEEAAEEWSGRDCAVSIDDARQDCILEFLDETASAALAGHYDVCHLGLTTTDDLTWPLPNVWLGVSVENQAAADERIPDLLATPAAVRFLSCEPLLGPVDVGRFMWPTHWNWDARFDTPEEAIAAGAHAVRRRQALVSAHSAFIDWTIAGCESGPGARPCDVAWLRSLRDQCSAAEVPFFLKQSGDWRVPLTERDGVMTAGRGSHCKAGGVIELPYLDGVQHAAFPARPA